MATSKKAAAKGELIAGCLLRDRSSAKTKEDFDGQSR